MPTASAVVSSSFTPTKPSEEDRIEPNKSAYTPTVLPPPKKLKSPFAKFEQQAAASALPPPRSTASSGPKKLNWSERQALAKKQQEEEEARSRAASYTPAASAVTKPVFKTNAPAFGRPPAPSTVRNFGAGVAAGAGVALVASRFSKQHEPEENLEPEPEPEPEPEIAVCSPSLSFAGPF